MTPSRAPDQSATLDVDAPADTVFALVTDLDALAAVAGEVASMRWLRGNTATPGAVFAGVNRHRSRRWSTRCTVTTAVRPGVFAFDVDRLGMPIAHWRYDIAAREGGCTVTEQTWDRRPAAFARVAVLVTGVADRAAVNDENIRATLARIKVRAENQ